MTPALKIRLKLLIVFLACFFLLIVVAAPFVITWGVNTAYTKDKISSVVFEKSGFQIEPDTFSIKLFPRPGIKINHLQIQPSDNLELTIQAIKLNLDLSELSAGKLTLGQIAVNRPELKILKIQKTDGKTSMPRPSRDFALTEFFGGLSKGFDFLPKGQQSLEIIIKNGVSTYFKGLNGSIYLNKIKNTVVVNTEIENIQVSPAELAGPDFSTYIDLDKIFIEKLDFNATLDTKKETQLFKGKCRLSNPKFVSKNKHTLLDTELIDAEFMLSPEMQRVTVSPMVLKYPAGNIGIDFSNTPGGKKAWLKFTGTDIEVEQAREMSLIMLKNIYVSQTLFEILLGGHVPQVAVSFENQDLKGLLDENNLRLSGNILNGKVHIPETRLIASRITGEVEIKDGVLKVIKPKGMIKNSEIKSGTLNVDLLNYEDVPFKGEFSIDLDLSMLPETLGGLLPKTLLAQELSKVEKVVGRCNSNLKLELKSGTDEPIVHVTTDDFSARGNYARIPGEVIIESIQIEYEPDIISLNNLKGTINKNRIENLSSTVQFRDDPWIDIKNCTADIDLSATISWLTSYKNTREIISPVQTGKGITRLSSLTLSGPVLKPEKWKYNATGKIKNSALSTQKNQKQLQNLSCDFQISQKNKHLKNLQMQIDSLDFLKPFSKSNYLDSIQMPLDLKKAAMKSGNHTSFFNGTLNFSSGPSLYLYLFGKELSTLKFNHVRFVDNGISNADIDFHHERNKPLFDFKGKFSTLSFPKIIKPGSALDKKIKSITDGQPILVHRDKDHTLNIITKSLNVDSFLSPSKKFSVSKNSSLLTEDLINFKADKLKVKNLCFTDVDTKISLKKDHSYIRLKKANLCDLKTQGYINLKNGTVYANIPFQANGNENIQSLLSCLFKKDEFMDGPYSFTCNLSSEGIPRNEVINKLTGELAFSANNGRIYKLTLLSRILSVLNVSEVFKGKIPNITQKGFAYKKITIDAEIKDSVIHLTNAVIDGQDMTMIFTGTLDPLNNKIDLSCLVAPFKTVDLIIEKIPIVNTLLGGRLVSVPVKATGELSDPSVIPLHPSAVGKGLVDMMSRILKSPITLWEKMLGEE